MTFEQMYYIAVYPSATLLLNKAYRAYLGFESTTRPHYEQSTPSIYCSDVMMYTKFIILRKMKFCLMYMLCFNSYLVPS